MAAARSDLLPFPASPNFVGRDALLAQIQERLFPVAGDGNADRFLVLTGPGGIGKTTLAREHAERFSTSDQDIFWIQAETDLIVGSFATLAFKMGLIPEPTADAHADAKLALQELSSPAPRLLILDNAEEEEAIQPWIPTEGGCRTLVTTRLDTWSDSAQTLVIPPLNPESAQELLQRIGHFENHENLAPIVEELGHLPLALELAASFMRELRLTPDDWLPFFRQSREQILKNPTPGATQHPHITTLWHLASQRWQKPTQNLLSILTFLAPNDIPLVMFHSIISDQESEGKWTEHSLSQALGELQRYSMIKLHQDHVSMHRLVQTVQCDRLSFEHQRYWAYRAMQMLNEVFPDVEPGNWDWCEILVPHLQQIARWISELRLETEQAGRLLNEGGFYHCERGRLKLAERLLTQALELRQQLLGEKHLDVSATLNDLAGLYNSQGRLEEAEPLLVWSLKLQQELLGNDHPGVAIGLNNIAVLRYSQSRYDEAEPMFVEALELQRRVLGEEHPDVAAALNNLAELYQSQGRHELSEQHYQQALNLYRRLFGDVHPDVATTMQGYATLLRELKRDEEAEQIESSVNAILRHVSPE